ncbi:putative glycosyltransferase 7 [Salvia miltiorrhiza]|uniref:putative glycosyltransferase 7 n=1 Tax=Salvia miltiorrhiza TaxID=226208 RepID=UPI0025AD4EFF|nr:putative glycosyltransferase 7 [Salvia miltiorrhiza]
MARRNNLQSFSIASVVIFLLLWSFTDDPWPPSLRVSPFPNPKPDDFVCQLQEPKDPTFYDEPTNIYAIDVPMLEWDKKRSRWFELHPAFSRSENRLLVVTGSQSSPCKDPLGDHFTLRFFKNKVDYCRIHGCNIFYNNALLHPKMRSAWAKTPAVRAAMVAHPEAEWLFWADSDAIFTDMDFEIPFERYKDYNLVVNGWPNLLVNRSWVAVNAGLFLIRNCQWSMEFLDVWAGMSPKSSNYKIWARAVSSTIKDRLLPDNDDQSSLIYLILKGRRKWREKIYVENRYALHGYWRMIVGRFDGLCGRYAELEGRQRRHAEAAGAGYAAERGRHAEKGGWRRPFVTHFTGCQPCSGDHNLEYDGETCKVEMERALNFADNQVLKNYGFVHPDLRNGSLISPLSYRFDRSS